MKFEDLLNYRDELVQQARLANVAYAYQWLGEFAARIAQSGLRGEVTLLGPDAEQDRAQPTLVAHGFSQSVIEEHFLPEEIAELADVLAFAFNASLVLELKFRLEDLGAKILPALRHALEAADVLPAEPGTPLEGSNLDAA